MAWANGGKKDASLFVGMTSRGWGAKGGSPYGLQRLVWTGKVPFEMHAMRAKSNGFELTFTQPVDKATAGDVASYAMESYTYKLEGRYGGPEADKKPVAIKAAKVSADGKKVMLVIDELRAGYLHELHAKGVKNADGEPLLHDKAFYTLVNIPK